MKIKNINLGKNKIVEVLITLCLFMICSVQADDLDYFGKKIDIRILDKLSSKNKLLQLNIGENFSYKNLEIKVLKCKNSKFDDNPEILLIFKLRIIKILIMMRFLFLMGGLFHLVRQSRSLIIQFMICGF